MTEQKTPGFDLAAAHRYFSAHCFNRAWDLIEKTERTAEDDRLMLSLSQASLYHWQQRDDCNSQRLSVAYWQLSRIQALLGDAAQATRMAQVCMSYSEGLRPFHLGFAHEAMARALVLSGKRDQAEPHLAEARRLAALVEGEQDRKFLESDLKQVDDMR